MDIFFQGFWHLKCILILGCQENLHQSNRHGNGVRLIITLHREPSLLADFSYRKYLRRLLRVGCQQPRRLKRVVKKKLIDPPVAKKKKKRLPNWKLNSMKLELLGADFVIYTLSLYVFTSFWIRSIQLIFSQLYCRKCFIQNNAHTVLLRRQLQPTKLNWM